MAGVIMAAAYLATRELWVSIGLHFAWNYTMNTVFSVVVSGHPSLGLLQGRLSGPDWLSGGAYGVEGSVVALAVTTFAGLGFLAVVRRQGHLAPPFWRKRALATGRAVALESRALVSGDEPAAL